jgi:hypothetical protein
MTAIESTAERTHLGTLTDAQARVLGNQRQKITQLAALLDEQKANYQNMIMLVMPEGANVFDPETMSFFYVQPPKPELVEDEEADELGERDPEDAVDPPEAEDEDE